MAYKRQTARFHVKTGPTILFDRVKHVMQGRRKLKMHADHLQQQAQARSAPLDLMVDFDPDEWDLRTAEVDLQTGKWVKSAWTRCLNGKHWWIVIGIGDVLMTVIDTDKFGLGPEIVRSGPVYDHAQAVNQRLMVSAGAD